MKDLDLKKLRDKYPFLPHENNNITLKIKNHLELGFGWLIDYLIPILYGLIAIGLLLTLFRMLYIVFWE